MRTVRVVAAMAVLVMSAGHSDATAQQAPSCSGSQNFGSVKEPNTVVASPGNTVLLATQTMGPSSSTAGWLALSPTGARLWQAPVTLGAYALGRFVITGAYGPVAGMVEGECGRVVTESVDVPTGRVRSIGLDTYVPPDGLTNPNIFAAGQGDFNVDGQPDQVIETRVEVPGEEQRTPVQYLSHNGRDTTDVHRSGTVAVLSPATGKTLWRWDYRRLRGPAPMSGFSGGRTFVVVKASVAVPGGFEYRSTIEGYRKGSRAWSTRLDLLRDAVDILDGPDGPLILTSAPTATATSGVDTGMQMRVTELDRRDGHVRWSRSWVGISPEFVLTRRGDLVGGYPDASKNPRTIEVSGRTGAIVFDLPQSFPGVVADLNRDGVDDAVFDLGYLDGRNGRVTTPSDSIPENGRYLVPVFPGRTGDAADLWTYSGTTGRGRLLDGRTLTAIWTQIDPAVHAWQTSGSGAPRDAAEVQGPTGRLLVLHRQELRRITAYDAATGTQVWEYRYCEDMQEPDQTLCRSEP